LSNEAYETLSWPTNLDRAAIVARLARLRETAMQRGLVEFASHFQDVETMPSAKIGAGVIAAINWLQDKPEYDAFAVQLQMVAVNLKNLK
jgi:hypothetical protein